MAGDTQIASIEQPPHAWSVAFVVASDAEHRHRVCERCHARLEARVVDGEVLSGRYVTADGIELSRPPGCDGTPPAATPTTKNTTTTEENAE